MSWGISATLEQYPLDFDVVKNEVDAGRPVLYVIEFSTETGHVGVLSNAWTDPNSGAQWVYFLDPDRAFFQAAGMDPFGWVPYSFILNGFNTGQGNWDNSFLGIQLG